MCTVYTSLPVKNGTKTLKIQPEGTVKLVYDGEQRKTWNAKRGTHKLQKSQGTRDVFMLFFSFLYFTKLSVRIKQYFVFCFVFFRLHNEVVRSTASEFGSLRDTNYTERCASRAGVSP